IKADFRGFSLRPSLKASRSNNYIFYNEEALPEQASGQAFIVIPGITTHFSISNKFHWQSEVLYSVVTGDASEYFRVPDIFVNSRIFFDGPLFNENIFVQIGLEGRYRSDYYADAYMPATQQFHLQDGFNIYAYPVVDAFLNFRIKRTRVLFRYNHLNINLLDQPGYFVTPGYTGLNNVLDLGINWS